jgi:hypothetical protein
MPTHWVSGATISVFTAALSPAPCGLGRAIRAAWPAMPVRGGPERDERRRKRQGLNYASRHKF